MNEGATCDPTAMSELKGGEASDSDTGMSIAQGTFCPVGIVFVCALRTKQKTTTFLFFFAKKKIIFLFVSPMKPFQKCIKKKSKTIQTIYIQCANKNLLGLGCL